MKSFERRSACYQLFQKFFPNSISLIELLQQVLGVVERLEQCSINKEEFLLLKALVLTNSDVRLQDNQALHRLRTNILQSLHDAVASIR